MTPLAAAAGREILQLHAGFVELFTGRSRDFSRCSKVFAPDMRMVTPEGVRAGRQAIMAALAAARAAPDFRIAISDISCIWESDNSVLLQYVEQQYRDGGTTRRLSTALFGAKAEAPCGVVWRYLHETWMRDTGAEQG
jgi:hypothetical protein